MITVGLGVLAALVCFIGSWHVSLWTDEAASLSGARRSLPDLWRMIHNIDLVHGSYYAFLHFWIEIFGSSAVSVRLPSALAAGISTSGVYLLARRMLSPRAAVAGALVFVVLPRTTWMGIEARPYAFAVAAAIWLSFVLLVALQKQGRWPWIVYGALAAVAVVINIYLALLLVAHGITMLIHRGLRSRQFWRWFAAAGTGLILASPVAYGATQQSQQIGVNRLGLAEWIRSVFVNQWFLGDTPTANARVAAKTMSEFSIDSMWKVGAVLLATCCWALIVYAATQHRRVATDIHSGTPGPWLLLLPWLTFPTLASVIFALLVSPIYNPRYLAFSAPAVAILTGLGLTLLRSRWTRLVAVVLILFCTAPIYVSQRQMHGKSGADWAEIASYVQSHKTANSAVYFSPRYPSSGETVRLTTRFIRVAYPRAFNGLLDVTLASTPVQDANLVGSSRQLADSTPVLKGITTVWVIRRVGYPPEWSKNDEAVLLGAGFHRSSTWRATLDEVVEFRRR